MVKLDIGCGPNKREGFLGVDQYQMNGVDIVLNVVEKDKNGKFKKWDIFEDNSVDEIHTSHFIEHLDHNRHNPERVHFFNEAYRVLKPGGTLTVITPHWASNRAYGDPTHADKPVSEMFYYYLSSEWRKTQAPHTDVEYNKDGLSCNFNSTWSYSFSDELGTRGADYTTFALQNFKEAILDMHATCVKL